MAYMRIHCGDCGMVKEVHKYVPDDTEVRYCPLCGSEIDRDIWETMIMSGVTPRREPGAQGSYMGVCPVEH